MVLSWVYEDSELGPILFKALTLDQHPPNYPLGDPIYYLMDTIRPLIQVHWGV